MESSELFSLVSMIRKSPWNYRTKPFQILNNIYYIGNQWVAAYLIDTGEGLILIDSNFGEVLGMLFDNIRALGFDPANIELLLLSHGHFDHIGGACCIQAASGCKTYFPKDDYFMLTERRELLYAEVPDFQIDAFYEYDSVIALGNTVIQPILTPGHTCGCTSFRFEAEFGGKRYVVAAHGGLGSNGLTRKELLEAGLPLALQQKYLCSLRELSQMDVDVFLPLHNSYYDILGLAERDAGDHSAFIQPDDWRIIMEKRIQLFEHLLAGERDSRPV